MADATAPVLTTAAVTVTTDRMGRLYAVIPDDVARLLTVASHQGIDPEARGIFFESDAHPANSWATATVRTIFEAVLSSPLSAEDVHTWGLNLYRKHDGGTLYGFIVGESGWDPDTRWWRDPDHTRDLCVRGNASIAPADRRALAGTCTF
ncbi:hypothetical protein ACFYPC_35630 [Streptomyces sp. NPDC005808]|uniref:hypothetical protein n=1 Tax=Streptomyces sp. NPDC005808 TaxID=3364734 RepID=UPI003679ED24